MGNAEHPGHQATLHHLREREQEEPLIRMEVAGTVFFDLFYRLLQGESERGVRIDDLVAALARSGAICASSQSSTSSSDKVSRRRR